MRFDHQFSFNFEPPLEGDPKWRLYLPIIRAKVAALAGEAGWSHNGRDRLQGLSTLNTVLESPLEELFLFTLRAALCLGLFSGLGSISIYRGDDAAPLIPREEIDNSELHIEIRCQRSTGVGRVDFAVLLSGGGLVAGPVICECDSKKFHGSWPSANIDRDRDKTHLAIYRLTTMRFTWDQVTQNGIEQVCFLLLDLFKSLSTLTDFLNPNRRALAVSFAAMSQLLDSVYSLVCLVVNNGILTPEQGKDILLSASVRAETVSESFRLAQEATA